MKLPPDDESPKLLYFSMRVGGDSPENQQIRVAIRQLHGIRDELLGPPESDDLRVDLTFDIPGPYSGPDYTGIRTGSFFRKDRVLVVQVAVPPAMVASEISSYLKETLRKTTEVATDFARRRKLTLRTAAVEQGVDRLINRLQP